MYQHRTILALGLLLSLLLGALQSCHRGGTDDWEPDTPLDPSLPTTTVFFVRTEHGEVRYVPRRRALPTDSEGKLSFTLVQLLLGPTTQEEQRQIHSEIPAGTVLLDTQEEAQRIVINLSEQFVAGGGSLSMKTRLNQLVKTIRNCRPGKPVVLLIAGKPVESIGGEGLFVANPLVPSSQEDYDTNADASNHDSVRKPAS